MPDQRNRSSVLLLFCFVQVKKPNLSCLSKRKLKLDVQAVKKHVFFPMLMLDLMHLTFELNQKRFFNIFELSNELKKIDILSVGSFIHLTLVKMKIKA